MKLEERMERKNGMTNLLFLLLGLILGLFIGVLSISLATYSKQAKRYRKEIKRLYEWQTINQEEDTQAECSREEL